MLTDRRAERPCEGRPARRARRLERLLDARVGRAVVEFGLIEPGDRILVGVSGGKDSWSLLHLLRRLQRRAPVAFELLAFNLDQGFAGFRSDLVEEYLVQQGYAYEMRHARVNLTVRERIEPGDTFCSLCARLRRGALYRYADELGCNKIALGHHADDFIETLVLNLFFNGRIKAMHPRFRATNGRHTVIRPLLGVWEAEIVEYATACRFPVVCCACPGCGDPTLERHRVKRLLRSLETTWPGIKRSLLGALGRVDLETLPIPAERRTGEGTARRAPVAGTGREGPARVAARTGARDAGPRGPTRGRRPGRSSEVASGEVAVAGLARGAGRDG